MIPKRIFYVWGANEKLKVEAQKCILSWRQQLPDYEIIQVDESSVKYFNFEEALKNKWFKTVYDKKLWSFVSDYIRVKVLHDHGGIYLDTDVTVVKSFNDVLDNKAFVGIQDIAIDGWKDSVEPAILGSEKDNPFLKNVISFYDKLIWEKPIYSIPDVFAFYLKEYHLKPFPLKEEQEIIKLDTITIYPEDYFIPYRYGKDFNYSNLTQNTHTIHWWNASWVTPEILKFVKNKHKKETAND